MVENSSPIVNFMGTFDQTKIFFFRKTKKGPYMEQLTVELVQTYPNCYNVMIVGYHFGYLEVRPQESKKDGSYRHDFDDLLKTISFTIMDNSLDSIKEIITQYYVYILTCSHFIIDNPSNGPLIKLIDNHQIPYDEFIIKRHSPYSFKRILFFMTDETAQAVKFLT